MHSFLNRRSRARPLKLRFAHPFGNASFSDQLLEVLATFFRMFEERFEKRLFADDRAEINELTFIATLDLNDENFVRLFFYE